MTQCIDAVNDRDEKVSQYYHSCHQVNLMWTQHLLINCDIQWGKVSHKNEHGNVYYDKDEKSSVSQMTSTQENLNRKKVSS